MEEALEILRLNNPSAYKEIVAATDNMGEWEREEYIISELLCDNRDFPEMDESDIDEMVDDFEYWMETLPDGPLYIRFLKKLAVKLELSCEE